jgi:hypothetical protein
MPEPAPSRPRTVCDFAREDLRQSTRFPKEPGMDFATIRWASGEEVLAEVHDESLTGICLILPDASGLAVGTLTELVYHATPLHGEVRHVTLRADGKYLIGFSCDPLSSASGE